jgi:hypothetical protein
MSLFTNLLSGGLGATLATVLLQLKREREQRIERRIQQAEELSMRISRISSLGRMVLDDVCAIQIGHTTIDDIEALRRKYDQGTITDLFNKGQIGPGEELQRARMLARFYFSNMADLVGMLHDEYYHLLELSMDVLNAFVHKQPIESNSVSGIERH